MRIRLVLTCLTLLSTACAVEETRIADAPTVDAGPGQDGLPVDGAPDAIMESSDAIPESSDAIVESSDAIVESLDATVESSDAISESSDAMNAPPPAFPVPARILFIGNSFTFGGPVPAVVDALANDAGWPDPEVVYSAFGGESLHGHRNNRPSTLERVDEGDWDVVVLQELSTRPTDNFGDPERFKADATWFHDRIKASSPDARVILYETWARHPNHGIYPNTFANPTEMQAQLRFHYNDAADRYIPANASAAVEPPVVVAPAGDTWEAHLAEPDPVRLHGDDDYHAGRPGQYLNGLVIYSLIYDRAVAGLTPWRVEPGQAARLQATVDGLTGREIVGGPDGMRPVVGLRPGQIVRVDVGDDDVGADWPTTWNGFDGPVGGNRDGLRDETGEATSVALRVTRGFGGINREGLADNGLDLPGGATHDTFFCGSFDDHADGLTRPGRLRFDGLEAGAGYGLILFASRTGTDGGLGRLTRYSVGDAWVDLEVADNRDRTARLEVAADAAGGFELEVGVSPAGTGRFCYLGALVLERSR